jgi:hypothetical protein
VYVTRPSTCSPSTTPRVQDTSLSSTVRL